MSLIARCSTRAFVAAVLLGLSTTGPATAADEQDLVIAIEPWAPFVADDLPRNGFLAVLTQAAFAEAGYGTRIQFMPWARALLEVQQGDRHALMGLYYTEERAKHYWYSDPVYRTKVGFVALDDFKMTSYDDLRELEGYRLGVGRGFANSPEFEAADYLNKQIIESQELMVRMLFDGRVDMVTGSFDRVRAMARDEGHDLDRLVYLEPALQTHSIHVGISRALDNGKAIRDAFDRGLARIRADGTYDRILAQFDIAH